MTEPEARLLLLIDGDSTQSRTISTLAARDGWRSLLARDPETAISTLASRRGSQLSAIILDHSVAGQDACVLISELKSRRPALPIVMLTADPSPLLAVEAMRAGATDYLIKPIATDRLMHALRTATKPESARDALAPLTEKMPFNPEFETMIGASPTFRMALAVAAKAARGNGPVLIEGEHGCGKEILIRAMHAASSRCKAQLQIVNVAGLSANSIESLLFGHEKGAFAGAFEQRAGVLQKCDGGTLALDDVDDLPLPVQARLLEFLKAGDVRPIGANHSFKVDVRIIASSNSALADLIETGEFLSDLAAALSPTRVDLPALRDRNEDIPALTRFFLSRIGEQPGLRELGITEGALSLLTAYDWPGNVRQLQAVLFRASVFCNGDALTPDDFPQLLTILGTDLSTGPGAPKQEGAGVMLYRPDGNLRPLDEIEADVIRLAIGLYRGRMTEVARRLGIGRSTLYRKLGELGIDNAA